MDTFRISGTGCALLDIIYNNVDFESPEFAPFRSKTPGDGGIEPGKLVFTDELGTFCGRNYLDAVNTITKHAPPATENIGGPSIVSLIHVAQMCFDQNVEVQYYGAIGNDNAGRLIRQKVDATPLVTTWKTSARNTPFTHVLSDPIYDYGRGERAFVNNIGAAWDMNSDSLPEAFFESNIVAFGATALVPNLHKPLTQLVRKAKNKGAFVIINTVFDFLNEKSNPGNPWPLGESIDTYSLTDLLITDQEEALRLTGKTTVNEAANELIAYGSRAFLITRGPEPVLAYSDGSSFKPLSICNIPVSEAVVQQLIQHPEQKGDTTGCGDNFAGGAIASVAMQMMARPGSPPDLLKVCQWAVASGGFACFYVGGTWYERFPGEKRYRIEQYL